MCFLEVIIQKSAAGLVNCCIYVKYKAAGGTYGLLSNDLSLGTMGVDFLLTLAYNKHQVRDVLLHVLVIAYLPTISGDKYKKRQ